jgi:DNA-binding NtrC family response regulator
MMQNESTGAGRKLRVLLVDDDAGIRSVVGRWLQGDGHYVETADDGLQGRERFKAGTWDVVITDRIMPRLNGDELGTAIKEINPAIPVILLTGSPDHPPVVPGDGSPFDIIVSKPFKYETIRTAIASLQLREKP